MAGVVQIRTYTLLCLKRYHMCDITFLFLFVDSLAHHELAKGVVYLRNRDGHSNMVPVSYFGLPTNSGFFVMEPDVVNDNHMVIVSSVACLFFYAASPPSQRIFYSGAIHSQRPSAGTV